MNAENIIFLSLFFVLVAAEWTYTKWKNLKYFDLSDSLMNIYTGVVGFVGSLLFTPLLYGLLDFLYQFAVVRYEPSPAAWCAVFLFVDFVGYWHHRLSHRINFLWAAHVVHHQSEYYNLTVGIRTSIFTPLTQMVFYAALPLVGFDPALITSIFIFSGILQLLVHTEHIRKLGVWEHILVTPSAHRVHHGQNDVYLDKNYGVVLILWDKLFGTYEPEIDKVQYGITSQSAHQNPVYVTFFYFRQIVSTAATLKGMDKIRVFFLPPAWAAEAKIKNENPSNLLTGSLKNSNTLIAAYCVFQLVASYLILLYSIFTLHPFLMTNESVANMIIACVASSALLEGRIWGSFLELIRWISFFFLLISFYF